MEAVLNNIQITLLGWFYALKNQLEEKHHDVVENKWIIWVVVLIAVIGGIGYAYYCTSKGYSFSGQVRWNWPRVWDIGIGCTPN
ncbi:hypothetical protein GCM10010954_16040 [Halobacillus andaensis]|uniref:Uncharacterized protein n=1 Tax=Halobacillus andaensis TaxID=1176239 RepID=A0A917B2W9_HALAA|nr:hypothetical protein [Halobacillus andaensis]MBP2004895.1 Tfp pilus assembly protein PilO [Halobacillus andaensis]GGF18053.1 hypothetical protein GCM10010954_16040 [Halobacillus andaensis]